MLMFLKHIKFIIITTFLMFTNHKESRYPSLIDTGTEFLKN